MTTNLPHLELAGATGLAGFAVWQLFSQYQSTAPKLSDVRLAPAGDLVSHQMLLDADVLVGGIAVLVGATTAVLARSWIPAALMLAGFLMVSLYYHAVCNSPNPQEAAQNVVK